MKFSPSDSRGFTLIEIMVVMMVIALITTMIALRMRTGGERQLAEEARRMNALVRLASEQALLQGRDIGLSVESNGYRFYMHDKLARQWMSLDNERIFRGRTMPHNMSMELAVEEQEVTWPEPLADDDDEENQEIPPPQVLILSTGEITPFDLYFSMDNVEPGLQLHQDVNGEREVIKHEFGF